MDFDNNVTLLNIANSVADTGSNFIPAGTVIHVELDGSGDFTNLQDAINYLTGKWSNGEVTIQMGEGNHTLPSSLTFDGRKYNIPVINLTGQGTDKTILNSEGTHDYEVGIQVNYGEVIVSLLTYQRTNGDKTTLYRGLVASGGTMRVDNVKLIGCNDAVITFRGGKLIVSSNLDISNSKSAITSINGDLYIDFGTAININNAATGLRVGWGGFIRAEQSTCTFTNVTTRYSQNVGNITTNGYISVPF